MISGRRRSVVFFTVFGICLVAIAIALNVGWVVGSIAMALADLGTPTTVGAIWMIAQALVVAGFAELQVTGLGRAER